MQRPQRESATSGTTSQTPRRRKPSLPITPTPELNSNDTNTPTSQNQRSIATTVGVSNNWTPTLQANAQIVQPPILPTSTSAHNSLRYHSSSTPYNYQTPSISSVITISSLLQPDQHTEELLAALTVEQLSLIEKTVQRVKRKKAKEQKKNPGTSNSSDTPSFPPQIIPSPTAATNAAALAIPQQQLPNIQTSPRTLNQSATMQPLVGGALIQKVNLEQQVKDKDHNHEAQNKEHGEEPSSTQQYSSIQKMSQPNLQGQRQFPLPSATTSQLQHQPSSSTIPSQQSSQDQQMFASLRRSETPITNPTPNHALPATDPVIEVRDGVEHVAFTYSVKGNNKEYRIRIDTESVKLEDITEQFKRDNCLYPRANCPEDKYQGNRWSYENECNILGWKLAWLNTKDISGKRGLLQRAVDSYRNRDPSLRSRRVVRNEKILNGTLRKRAARDGDGFDGGPDPNFPVKRHRASAKQFIIEDVVKGTPTRIRIRAEVETVNIADLTDEFKNENCLYPGVLCDRVDYKGSQWEFETWSNELGWKLAHLNKQKISNNKPLLKRVLDLYQTKFAASNDYRPRRGKYTLSAKFFENHPRGIASPSTSTVMTSNANVDNNIVNTHSEDNISPSSPSKTSSTNDVGPPLPQTTATTTQS